MDTRTKHSLKKFNSFGIDVSADEFIEVYNEEEVQNLLNIRDFEHGELLVLGGGSNILPVDDINGTVLKISIPGINIISESGNEVLLKAGAGVIWDDLVKYAVDHNLAGIENLSLIPGTAGAAPIQNIGAYGQELSDVFRSLEGYFIADGMKKSFQRDDCLFGYRDSIFKNELKGKFIITSITLALLRNFTLQISYKPLLMELSRKNLDDITLKDMRELVIRIRKSKLPDPQVLGNAGSFFKNPEVTYGEYSRLQEHYDDIKGFDTGRSIKLYAGWLIEKAGWKGKRSGNVGTYPNQALVVVNYGNASGSEILTFTSAIKESVKDYFNITLQEEVNIIP